MPRELPHLLTSWKDHLLKHYATDYQITEKPHVATFTHPGLNFLAIDRTGSPGLSAIMQLTQDVVFFPMYQPYFKDGKPINFISWPQLTSDRMWFVGATQFTISRAMYNNTIAKWPVDAKVSFGPLGTSSMILLYQIYLKGRTEPLVTRVNKMISINPETRKPKPYPDWFREKMKGCEVEIPDLRVDRLQRPSKTFVERFKVVWSDTDENNHTNFASYIRFGLDTLHLGLTLKANKDTVLGENEKCDKHLDVNATSDTLLRSDSTGSMYSRYGHQNDTAAIRWMTLNAMNCGVKTLSVCFLSESYEGDELNTHIWQEEGEELSVKCSVEALDGRAVCQFTLEFFGPSAQL